MARVQDDLIFDFGLHRGFDAEYYLRKGFRVLALEADPTLAAAARDRLVRFGDRLTILQRALADVGGTTISFYTVPGKDDWGSLFRDLAEKGSETAVEITVETVDLHEIFDRFGVPYYLKCDMEGGDVIFRRQLAQDTRRPTFVSVEMNDGDEPGVLAGIGYDRGQIVNQWMHPFRRPSDPAREGHFAEVAFTGEMSGPFGHELDAEKWRPIDEAAAIYRHWKTVRDYDADLSPGWVDLHVCHAETLALGSHPLPPVAVSARPEQEAAEIPIVVDIDAETAAPPVIAETVPPLVPEPGPLPELEPESAPVVAANVPRKRGWFGLGRG